VSQEETSGKGGTPGLIRGQVAKVLTSRELVINRGARNGVELGMRFEVLDPNAEEVQDPETGEVLGSLRRPKATVKVVEVEDRLARAQTYRSRRFNVGGSGAGGFSELRRALEPPKWVVQHETFKTDDQTWEMIGPGESVVKIGDPVQQVTRPED
jgi:hypothetical protein